MLNASSILATRDKKEIKKLRAISVYYLQSSRYLQNVQGDIKVSRDYPRIFLFFRKSIIALQHVHKFRYASRLFKRLAASILKNFIYSKCLLKKNNLFNLSRRDRMMHLLLARSFRIFSIYIGRSSRKSEESVAPRGLSDRE